MLFKEVASYLEEECKDGQITLNDAKVLAIKALSKNSRECELTSDSIKIVTLTHVRNKPTIKIMTSEDLKTLIKTCKEKEYEETKSVPKEPPRKSKKVFPIQSSAIPSTCILSVSIYSILLGQKKSWEQFTLQFYYNTVFWPPLILRDTGNSPTYSLMSTRDTIRFPSCCANFKPTTRAYFC